MRLAKRNWAKRALLGASLIVFQMAVARSAAAEQKQPEIWRDSTASATNRARDLVKQLTLEEKVSQLMANPPAIERLGIRAYSHRNECLHGIISGNGTVFPQAIGMAATWDPALIQMEADAISMEARAKHNDYIAHHGGDSGEQVGLNFYAPNLNIFRDPRWGRGQETYGEDPFLTGQMGVAFIRGLQGDDSRYVKAVACAKHFAVHSGPEAERHHFNATPPERDLYDTYLPAFEAAVREGHVGSVMGAYSALDGTPDCANPFLLTDLLRQRWGFDGVVFSDGGAIGDIWAGHQFVKTPEEAAAVAVKAGCDVSSGGMGPTTAPVTPELLKGGRAFSALAAAVRQGLIPETEVDAAVTRELALRFKLGVFDPPSVVPWANLGLDQTDTAEHRALAVKVAQESVVLLKNDGVLPLDRTTLRHILVVGSNATSTRALMGNYTGKPSKSVTVLEGIQQLAGAGVEVNYVPGIPLATRNDHSNWPAADALAAVVTAAQSAEVVIFVGGLDATLEREQGRTPFVGFDSGDRTAIELPGPQIDTLHALAATGKPIVFVNCSGSAMAMRWEAANLPAILQAWYPGEEGGTAVAQALFGEINPAGRLPVTFYAGTSDLPAFDDYSMDNRTYRYFKGKALFAFGHGLSYTSFAYADAQVSGPDGAGEIGLNFKVSNSGAVDGEDVPQVYVARGVGDGKQPVERLCGFARIAVKAKGEVAVSMKIPMARLRHWDVDQHRYVVEGGDYQILVGGASDDIRLRTTVTVPAASY